MRHLPIIAACLLSVPAPALADVTIHYGPVGDSNQQMTIEADGAGNIRAEAGPGQIILIRADGKAYLAVPGDESEFASMVDYVAVIEARNSQLRASPRRGQQRMRPLLPEDGHYVVE